MSEMHHIYNNGFVITHEEETVVIKNTTSHKMFSKSDILYIQPLVLCCSGFRTFVTCNENVHQHDRRNQRVCQV